MIQQNNERKQSKEGLAVSVIVPAYNASDTIADTLNSVLAQTHTNWEIVVVDDGSNDRTLEIAKQFAERDARIGWTTQSNGGEASARNTGLRSARNDWLLFLDSDDWIAPDYLEKMTARLTSNPELDAVICGSARVAENGVVVPEQYRPPEGDLFPILARRAAFPVHACIVRRSLVEEVGRFDPSLIKSPDWDLWQRIARTGAHFGGVYEILAFYRMRPKAASLEALQLFKDGLRVLKQGHSPDIRVPHPDPAHANGLPPEDISRQEFYLLSWCAGLMLGHGLDARPLFQLVNEDQFPELYPEAVAQCLFDSVPLPACQPPESWFKLAVNVLGRTDDFLVDLEQRSGAVNLVTRAKIELRKMILQHSPEWKPLIEHYERMIQEERTQIEEALQQNENLQRTIRELEEKSSEQNRQLAASEQARNAIQQQLSDTTKIVEEYRTVIDAGNSKILELETAKTQAEQLAEQRKWLLTELNKKFWVRLGVKLRTLRIPLVRDRVR